MTTKRMTTILQKTRKNLLPKTPSLMERMRPNLMRSKEKLDLLRKRPN